MAKALKTETIQTETTETKTVADLPKHEHLALTGRLRMRRALATLAALGITVVLALLAYLAVMWLAVELVPLVGMLVLSQIGADPSSLPVQTLLLYWVAPTLVLLMVVAWVAVSVLRGLWRLRMHLVDLVHRALTGQGRDWRPARGGRLVDSISPARLSSARQHPGVVSKAMARAANPRD